MHAYEHEHDDVMDISFHPFRGSAGEGKLKGGKWECGLRVFVVGMGMCF